MAIARKDTRKGAAQKEKAPARKKPAAKAVPRSSYEIIGPRPTRRCANRSVKIRGIGVGRHRNRMQAKRLTQSAWNAQMSAGLIAANRLPCPGRCREGNCRKIGRLTLTGFGGGPGRAWTFTPTKPQGWIAVFRKWRNYKMTCRCC